MSIESLPDWVRWSAYIIAGLAAGLYLAAPVAIKFWFRQKATPTIQPFAPAEVDLPAETREFLEQSIDELKSAGFEVARHLILPDLVSNAGGVLTLFLHYGNQDAAVAIIIYGLQKTAEGTKRVTQAKYVELSTDFLDGSSLSTTNAIPDTMPAPIPGKQVMQFENVQDAEALYRYHRCFVAEFGSGRKEPLPTEDELLDWFRRGLTREQQGQVAAGYFFFDKDREAYRLTWKGAYLMTWKQLWPLNMIFRASRRRRARAAVARWAGRFVA